jgi:trehalose 6-phosphate phosphatase
MLEHHYGTESLASAAASRTSDSLLCVFAFDGVLAEYASDPDTVVLPPARCASLQQLIEADGVTLAVISGRPLDDLIPRVDLGTNVYYIGLHGLEVRGPGLDVRWELADVFRCHMDGIAEIVMPHVARVAGARLEHKGAALALHTHDASSSGTVWLRFQMLNAAAPLINSTAVRVLRGRDVFELLPNVAPRRSDAILEIRRLVEARSAQPVFTVYVGPSVLDDDALAAVRETDAVAVVGGSPPVSRSPLSDPTEVARLIDELTALRRPSS